MQSEAVTTPAPPTKTVPESNEVHTIEIVARGRRLWVRLLLDYDHVLCECRVPLRDRFLLAFRCPVKGRFKLTASDRNAPNPTNGARSPAILHRGSLGLQTNT